MIRWNMSSRLAPVVVIAWLALSCGGEIGKSGTANFSRCTRSSECIVAPASCCGFCGAATRGDAIGLNESRADEYRTSVCDGRGCPACYSAPDPTLVSTCGDGTCAVIDLHEHPSAACTSDSDCRIRTQGCCECGGTTSPGTLIAVSDPGLYTSLVCDPGQSCPECAPLYPPEVVPRCTSGHCTAEDPRYP